MSLIENLTARFIAKPHYLSRGAGYLAKQFKCTPEDIKQARRNAKESLRADSNARFNNIEADIEVLTVAVGERITKVNNDKGTLESSVESTFEPKSDLELAELHKVDLSKYKISNYWSKLKTNGKFTSSILCTLIKPTDFSLEDFAKYLVNYKPTLLPTVKKDKQEALVNGDEVDVVISLADFHLDKLDITVESVENKVKMYTRVLKNLIDTSSRAFNVNKVVFVIGNDLFQTDNIQGATTSGTIVDHSITWNKAYEIGFDLMVTAINLVKQYANEVQVVLVQGNHARTKEYYLAHALDVYFKNDVEVSFEREFTTVKHIVIGNTFIGYHHGNTKIDDLPLLFATSPESSAAFGNAKYREVHTGDKHYYLAKEIKGVRVQQMPSLSGTDRWHADNNFVNSTRAGLALVYHPVKGKVGEFEERI